MGFFDSLFYRNSLVRQALKDNDSYVPKNVEEESCSEKIPMCSDNDIDERRRKKKTFLEFSPGKFNFSQEIPMRSDDDIYERGRKKKILREISPGQYQEVTLIETRPNSGIYHDLDAHRDMINEEIRNHNYFK